MSSLTSSIKTNKSTAIYWYRFLNCNFKLAALKIFFFRKIKLNSSVTMNKLKKKKSLSYL